MDYEITYNSLTLGPGTAYKVRGLEGFWRRATNLNTPPLPRYHGGIVGASYEETRPVSLTVAVTATTTAVLSEYVDDLLAAFEPRPDDETALTVTLPGLDSRQIMCRPQAATVQVGPAEWAAKTADVSIRLVASDPVWYSTTETSVILTPYTSAAGLSYPVSYPKSYGSGGSGGGFSVTNAGDWETWPTFTISGPSSGTLSDPFVENVTDGTKLAFTANGGVDIAVGQSLIVSTHPKDRTANFATGASRRGRLSSDSVWFPLNSGTTELRFRASGTTTDATCTVTHRSAWI